ncbi:MAG: DNA-binding transcriptional regulator FrlR [Lentisphaerae bacterium ADurb.Bin242]|nr:MAG: DNA-binding transcriptional regulator FrlR [Lentisphaerae bacterium ADurb.Bin242]
MTMYQKITDDILGAIQAGKLAPGDRISSVREITEKYGVSQITALRVFKELLNTGKVVRRNGSGYYVKSDSDIPEIPPTLFCAFRPPKLIDNIDNLGTRILCGIVNACAEHRVNLLFSRNIMALRNIVCTSDETARFLAEELRESTPPAGIILDHRFTDAQIEKYLFPVIGNTPIAIVGRRSALPVLTTSIPAEAAAAESAKLALQCRPEEFIIFSAFQVCEGKLFCECFRKNLIGNGFPESAFTMYNDVLQKAQRDVEIFDEVTQRLRTSRKRTLLCSSTDFWSIFMQEHLARKGIVFGRDAALLSAWHVEKTDSTVPRITSIDYFPEQFGSLAVRAILNRGDSPRLEYYTEYRILLNETWSITK